MTGMSHGAGTMPCVVVPMGCERTLGPIMVIMVMGAEQLTGVLDIIKRASAANGKEVNEEELAMDVLTILGTKINHESHARFATARIWDDGIIDLADTRMSLAYRCRPATRHRWKEP